MTYVAAALRREVITRAGNCCEYCLVSQDDRLWPYEIDHIIAEKHGGSTESGNLCWSCYLCNGYKGSDIGSIDWGHTERLTPLFNPRTQLWEEHFHFEPATGLFEGLSPKGRVTIYLLRLNSDEQVKTRQLLLTSKRYPCPESDS